MSLAGSEIFSQEELSQLNADQLRRVMSYFDLPIQPKMSRPKMIEAILNYQRPQAPYGGNADWQPGIQRSVRVQRLYELNVLGKKL